MYLIRERHKRIVGIAVLLVAGAAAFYFDKAPVSGERAIRIVKETVLKNTDISGLAFNATLTKSNARNYWEVSYFPKERKAQIDNCKTFDIRCKSDLPIVRVDVETGQTEGPIYLH